MKTGEQGEAAQVIEVAVGQENEIELTSANLVVAWQGVIPRMLGVQTGINRKLKRANFTVRAICPDAPVRVEVGKLHEVEGGAEESIGTSIRKGSIRTCTLPPCSSTPWKDPRASADRWVTW